MRESIRIRTAICFAGLFLILFSCANNPTEIERTPTSTFPLTEGSRWEYSGLWFTVPIDSSASADTIEKEIFRQIIGPDTLPGITDLMVCDDTVISYLPAAVDTVVNRNWLKIEDNRLKNFAHAQFQIGEDPNPYIFDPPRNLLDFPLNTGKEWDAGDTGPGISRYEERRIVGIDYIELPGGWQYCDVLRSDLINTLIPEDTIQSSFKWYSDDGLMRSETDYGNDIINSVRTYEYWELIDMDIQP